MCYSIKCGGALRGATVIAISAADTLRQAERLASIGAHPLQILKADTRPVSLFEVNLFAVERPIKIEMPTWPDDGEKLAAA